MVYASSREDVVALSDIGLTVREGEFVSLLGPSGCGKSTLLKLMGGLLAPSSGSIRIFGGDVRHAVQARTFGFVFQEPTLLPWRSILHNATVLLEVVGQHSRHEMNAIAQRLLRLVGLEQFLHHYPRELSGGMKQRVAIARALSIDPKILLMDEPFGALDAITRDRMNLDLLEIWAQTRKTIVFVTHSIAEAVFLSDVVYLMSARPGRILEEVRIDLPRPRALEVQDTAEFVRYARHLRDLLERGASYALSG
jgi:NitT/TauT family transport system ATP-binding protein